MRVLVALALLVLIPGASADIIWDGPDQASAGAPVFLSYTIQGPEGLEGHVNVRLEAWHDDTLVLETDSVHEHDGVFPTVLSALEPGTLRVVATREGASAEHTVQVVPAEAADLTDVDLVTDGMEMRPKGPGPALVDVPRGDGTLVLSAWTEQAMVVYPYEDAVAARGLFTGDGPGARWVEADGPVGFGNLVVDMGNALQQPAPCPDRVVVDPNSAAMAAPAWQAKTNIRATVLGAEAPIQYTMLSAKPIGPSMPSEIGFQVTAAPEHPQVTFRPGEPGHHWLHVLGDGLDCTVQFAVVPAPEGEGSVEAHVTTGNGTMDIHLRALALDGSLLGHYEFDTRVVRLEDDRPGRLAWAGKVHGHGGEVRVRLHDLEPGTYDITTFPSPQGASTPGVAQQGGFRYTAHIAAPATVDVDEAGQDASLPWLTTMFALAVALLRRR